MSSNWCTETRNGPQRLQRALALVHEQLRITGERDQALQRRRSQLRLAYVDERLATAIGGRIDAAGGTLSTSLDRLAASLALGVDELRQGVIDLEYAGLIVARRHGNVVPVDELAVQARVELSAA